MATCKIIPIKLRLDNALDYIQNGDKTESGDLVSGIECVPKSAYEDMMSNKKYYNNTGGILGFHLIQSFKPGEVDYDTAHNIGIELANNILDKKHMVVVSTHTNCGHIHNHILWDSVSFVDGSRYHDNKSSYYRIREISDQLCKEHGLSIIEPKNKGLHYKEWLAIKEGNSWKQMMKSDIDTAINN